MPKIVGLVREEAKFESRSGNFQHLRFFPWCSPEGTAEKKCLSEPQVLNETGLPQESADRVDNRNGCFQSHLW